MNFAFGSVENIVGKGENAGCQHFLPFPTTFSKGFYERVDKSQDCVIKSFNFIRKRPVHSHAV